jgi:hypothetical protein
VNIYQRIALAVGMTGSLLSYGGSLSYSVSLNPGACREIHLGQFTVPPAAFTAYDVVTGYCRPDVRTAGEAWLYATAACHVRGNTWIPAPQKYAVDLSGRKGTRRISEAEWEAASELPVSERPLLPRPDVIKWDGPILLPSGPRWKGIGASVPWSHLSSTGARAAINSWDGFEITYTFLDPTSFGQRDKVKGEYWVDIYETATARPLIRIHGSFRGAEPSIFLNQANWYSDRYYVMPVGGTTHVYEFNLRDLLVCDADAASRVNGTSLKERK